MQLDADQGKPIFIQLAEGIEDSILKGIYAEETQVPSINEVSITLKVNPATANRGVNLLVDEGILYKKRGMGMFVCTGSKVRILARRRQAFYPNFILPMLREANLLGYTPDDLAALLKQSAEEYHS